MPSSLGIKLGMRVRDIHSIQGQCNSNSGPDGVYVLNQAVTVSLLSHRVQSGISINGVDELLVGHQAAVAVEVVLRQLVPVPRRHGGERELAQVAKDRLVEAVRVEAVQARDDLLAAALILGKIIFREFENIIVQTFGDSNGTTG